MADLRPNQYSGGNYADLPAPQLHIDAEIHDFISTVTLDAPLINDYLGARRGLRPETIAGTVIHLADNEIIPEEEALCELGAHQDGRITLMAPEIMSHAIGDRLQTLLKTGSDEPLDLPKHVGEAFDIVLLKQFEHLIESQNLLAVHQNRLVRGDYMRAYNAARAQENSRFKIFGRQGPSSESIRHRYLQEAPMFQRARHAAMYGPRGFFQVALEQAVINTAHETLADERSKQR